MVTVGKFTIMHVKLNSLRGEFFRRIDTGQIWQFDTARFNLGSNRIVFIYLKRLNKTWRTNAKHFKTRYTHVHLSERQKAQKQNKLLWQSLEEGTRNCVLNSLYPNGDSTWCDTELPWALKMFNKRMFNLTDDAEKRAPVRVAGDRDVLHQCIGEIFKIRKLKFSAEELTHWAIDAIDEDSCRLPGGKVRFERRGQPRVLHKQGDWTYVYLESETVRVRVILHSFLQYFQLVTE